MFIALNVCLHGVSSVFQLPILFTRNYLTLVVVCQSFTTSHYPIIWHHVISLAEIDPGHGKVCASPFTVVKDCLTDQLIRNPLASSEPVCFFFFFCTLLQVPLNTSALLAVSPPDNHTGGFPIWHLSTLDISSRWISPILFFSLDSHFTLLLCSFPTLQI